MGPGLVYDDSAWVGGAVTFGPSGVSGTVTGGAGTGGAQPCGPGTSCGASQNNFALIVIVVAVAVLILR
jgi:hypothetical protein